jgi:SNF2 family DNA or RNA helicase
MKSSGKNSQLSGPKPAAYQLVPLTKLITNGHNFVLICDGVGVGKTISAGYILSWAYGKTRRRSWIICPPNLMNKWALELEHKFGFRSTKVDSVAEFRTMEDEINIVPEVNRPSCYIIPNSLFHSFDLDDQTTVPVVVFDEIHAYRNPDTRWHQTALRFSERGGYRVGLTATPINNGLDDLVSEFNILLPRAKRHVLETTIQDMWVSERKRVLNPFVTRFTKERLGIHFARRIIKSIVVEYPPSYTNEVMALIHARSKSRSILDKITHFRMAASSPAAISKSLHAHRLLIDPDPKLEVLREAIGNTKHARWIIFCEFLETAKLIAKNLAEKETFVIAGETPQDERQGILQDFKETRNSVLVLTSVGSEGIDLQFCDALVNYDLHWNPMKLEQRIGRIDRVGQDKDAIYIVNLVVSGGIDERVASVILRKLGLVKNSPFAVQSLFGNIRESKNIRPMFDVEVLDHELEEGDELVNTINLSGQILADDYRILPSINLAFCDPKRLQGGVGKGAPWISKEDRKTDWFTRIETDADHFKNILGFYN